MDCVRENRTNKTEHVWRAFTTEKAHRRFGLNEANNSKTHACDLISIQQQSAREYWTKKMNTKRKKKPSTVGLFSHVKMLYLQIFHLNPIPDLRSTATYPINRTHLHTRTSTNDTTLIELNDRINFGIRNEKKNCRTVISLGYYLKVWWIYERLHYDLIVEIQVNITGLEIWVNAVTRIKQRSFDWKLSENFKKQQLPCYLKREKITKQL